MNWGASRVGKHVGTGQSCLHLPTSQVLAEAFLAHKTAAAPESTASAEPAQKRARHTLGSVQAAEAGGPTAAAQVEGAPKIRLEEPFQGFSAVEVSGRAGLRAL